jgi:tripartite-type tricarboxylate transporter receptor subunit TctC
MAGTTQLSFLNIATVTTQVQAGVLKPIAVSSLARHPLFPAVPTVAETLPGFEGGSWHSFVAPAATPEAVLARIHAALTTCLRLPEVDARLTRIGFSVVASSRAEMATRVAAELARWKDVVQAAGIRPT